MKIIDLHCDTITCIYEKKYSLLKNECMVDINKLINSHYVLQVFALFIPFEKIDNAIEYTNNLIRFYYNELEKHNVYINHINTINDIKENFDNDIISCLLSLEDGGVINNDLSNLYDFYLKGVRMITITWNYPNCLGFPSNDILNRGLTPFGIKVIRKMEELGMIIDVSHLSDQGFYDVFENTKKPFIASHSNCRSLCNHYRNLTDDMIRKISERKGVIGINNYRFFVNDNGSYVNVKDLIKHINHLKKIGGIDVISLGFDFDGIDLNNEIIDCGQMEKLIIGLQEEGYTKQEIEKIMYKNALRFFKSILK